MLNHVVMQYLFSGLE